MPFLNWTDDPCVGHPLVDSQHKKLVGLVNDLHDARGSGEDPSDVLMFLVNYAGEHFSDEEKLMQETGYPALDEHREKHGAVLREVERRTQAFMCGAEVDLGEMLDFLKSWLVDHILGEDKRIGAYLESREVATGSENGCSST